MRENHKGYCSIQGNPGIGKSALIAQFFKDLRAQKEITNVQVVEYFMRRGTIQATSEYVLNYLIRRTDELFAPGKEIRAEGKAVWDLQQQLFAKWRLWGEQRAGKKLLFLIDGLDEGTENNVVTYMPRENFEGVLIIYGSRPGGHKSIEDLWTQLPVEHHTKLELAGLGREDIRALIYEVANKYEVERESAWIDAVQQRSQGNPLYLKLLCDALEHGSIALNDIQALPDKIDEYYKAILDRYAADTVDGDALLAGLFTFAAARDYLTMAHLGLINKLGDATVQRIGSTLKEVLYENPLTEDVLDYQLFHESFREYLVKEKALKVKDAMERIIDFCGTWREHEGTWEQRYALQHYAAHAAASAREARAAELLTLPGNTAYIETQKKVLKQFDATKELYRLGLLKASELKQYDKQLEAALCLVDLKYEEANDAPQVVALAAAGDIDLALKRIESFGGNDEEGVKRRFTLYMLCLMELTLLESKTKPFRKTAIERLLNHLDEHIPPDTSIIDWNEFFPSYLMFLMACECAELGIDYLMVYKRTIDWEKDWLVKSVSLDDSQLKVLLEGARFISRKAEKSRAFALISSMFARNGLSEVAASVMREAQQCALEFTEFRVSSALESISVELAKQGKFEEALECARGISDGIEKNNAMKEIAGNLAKQGRIDFALECARDVSLNAAKSSMFAVIAAELTENERKEEAASAIEEALLCAHKVADESERNIVLKYICQELAKQDRIVEALENAIGITDESERALAMLSISSELVKQGRMEEAANVDQEIIEWASSQVMDAWNASELCKISGELAKYLRFEEADNIMQKALISAAKPTRTLNFFRDIAFMNIIDELTIQGKFVEAVFCVPSISELSIRSVCLRSILNELAQESIEQAAILISEALDLKRLKHNFGLNYGRLEFLSCELARHGKIEVSLECARIISEDYMIIRLLQSISNELFNQGSVDNASSVLQEALVCANDMENKLMKGGAFSVISKELAKQGKFQQALECTGRITEDFVGSALRDISTEMAKQGKVEEALACARAINSATYKSSALVQISGSMAKGERKEESHLVMLEALACTREISNDYWKINELRNIYCELAKQSKEEEAASVMQEALACARGISDDYSKSLALKDISTELSKNGRVAEVDEVMEEALECAMDNSDESNRSYLLVQISTEMATQGKFDKALVCAKVINDVSRKSSALKDISIEQAK